MLAHLGASGWRGKRSGVAISRPGGEPPKPRFRSSEEVLLGDLLLLLLLLLSLGGGGSGGTGEVAVCTHVSPAF